MKSKVYFEYSDGVITVTGERLQNEVYDYSTELAAFLEANGLMYPGEPEGETIDGLYQEKISVEATE